MTSANKRCRINLALTAASVAASAFLHLHAPRAIAVPLEIPITPTVHPAIGPNSAIPVPLLVRADRTSVWKSDLEQRMLVTGRVRIEVGYRTLRADSAAIWITPSRDFGETALDVAIFLSGNIHVAEGDRSTSTQTSGKELLVTTRISRSVQLAGTPVSKVEEDSPVFKRGEQIRQELLTRPSAPPHIPQITITTAEAALQAGWIAKGPNNRIIAGPGDVQTVRGPGGRLQLVPPEKQPKAARPGPRALIATDQEIRREQRGNEWLNIIRNPYMLLDLKDGSPPLEFHAQNMVAFTPPPARRRPQDR